MLRRALPLSAALALILGCTHASAAQITVPVRGDVKAIALAGDALIVARQPAQGGIVVERLAPGAPARRLLRLPGSRGDDDIDVVLAASAQALAVSVLPKGDDDPESSRVLVGPPAGPLRAVAACAAGLLPPPVAVSGSRVAWLEGGCGVPPREPRATTPGSVVIGGSDVATPLRRVVAADEALPTAIVLSGESGLVGVLRPSFFTFFKSEVRRFGPSGLGETVAREDTRIVLPVGVLSNGDGVLFRGELEDEGGDDGSSGSRCGSSLFVIAPGSGVRRVPALGGCPKDAEFTGGAALVAGDRVYSLGTGRPSKSGAPRAVALTSVRGDGRDARLLARGTYRPPLGIAATEPGRAAWFERRCAGGSEIVIYDGAARGSASSIASCTVKLLNRSARMRGNRITLRLRCPSGCSGQAFAGRRGTSVGRSLSIEGDTPTGRSFSFERGTHSLRLRLRLTRRERRAKRLRVAFEVENGPSRSAVIRLR